MSYYIDNSPIYTQVKLWTDADRCDSKLLPDSKTKIQEYMKDWLDRREFIHCHWKTHLEHVFKMKQEILYRARNSAEIFVSKGQERRCLEDCNSASSRFKYLEKGLAFLNDEADLLCESLKVNHGVLWEDLRNVDIGSPRIADVAAALKALGQDDIGIETLRIFRDLPFPREDQWALQESEADEIASLRAERDWPAIPRYYGKRGEGTE